MSNWLVSRTENFILTRIQNSVNKARFGILSLVFQNCHFEDESLEYMISGLEYSSMLRKEIKIYLDIENLTKVSKLVKNKESFVGLKLIDSETLQPKKPEVIYGTNII